MREEILYLKINQVDKQEDIDAHTVIKVEPNIRVNKYHGAGTKLLQKHSKITFQNK